ncbi:MAG: glutamine--fructose-6-phosphate transaminase (isomerizing) [Ruminococcus sp.]|nr:glutamine--fructose-6-phosphate transaminase (isomerizing) [Ruminococcus sp.]
MCGIVGYNGKNQAGEILLEGLEKLEYRGYDSAGISVHDGKHIGKVKAAGRLKVLNELTKGGTSLKGTLGIGHTRWATHGVPSDENAHPHFNKEKSISVVHNGIIENYMKLKKYLEDRGYEFVSETDTEVIAHLLDYYYKGDPIACIIKVIHRIEGSYALGILFKDHPDEMYAVRKDSPLIVGKSKIGGFIASDVPAVLKYTREVYFMENDEIAIVGKNEITFYNIDEEKVKKDSITIDWDINAAEKAGYEHFMLKEIYEQPQAVKDTLNAYMKSDDIHIEDVGITDDIIKNLKKINIVACGSAYHTGMAAKYIFEDLVRIPVEVDLASEFRYRNPIMQENTLTIVVTQSGETADTLASLREAKKLGGTVLGIVNVLGSSIARESDYVMYTYAGPEIAVATTKAYSTQLIAQYILAVYFAKVRGEIDKKQTKELMLELKRIPQQIDMLLNNKEKIQKFANRYLAAQHVFFLGRGLDYAISMEGSLKLKEISYIHSEAYAAGELKHGTISLIEEGTLVIALMTQEHLMKKIAANVEEVKTRGAFVLAVTNEGHTDIEEGSDFVLYLPVTHRYFTNSVAVVPLQLFAYYISLGRGLDIDKPRNLAKSVTVE